LFAALLELSIGGVVTDALVDAAELGAVELGGVDDEFIVCANAGVASSADIAIITGNGERLDMCVPPDFKNPLHAQCLTRWIGSIGDAVMPAASARDTAWIAQDFSGQTLPKRECLASEDRTWTGERRAPRLSAGEALQRHGKVHGQA
jgi:hypothetical protein